VLLWIKAVWDIVYVCVYACIEVFRYCVQKTSHLLSAVFFACSNNHKIWHVESIKFRLQNKQSNPSTFTVNCLSKFSMLHQKALTWRTCCNKAMHVPSALTILTWQSTFITCVNKQATSWSLFVLRVPSKAHHVEIFHYHWCCCRRCRVSEHRYYSKSWCPVFR